ncbi:MAG: response regulator transcription factor [Agriterribacter sp.]
MNNAEKIKILIVDDHLMVQEGMKALLGGMDFVRIAGTAGNAFEAMHILKDAPVDLALVDISLPEVSGIELIEKIKKEYPAIKILAMSTFKERSYISQAVLHGASGYLFKSASKEEIEEAIFTVYEGKLFLSLEIDAKEFHKGTPAEIPILTRREKEILNMIAEGLTNSQIADKLFISLHTVDSHRKNILTKFAVNNTAALIKAAAKLSLI